MFDGEEARRAINNYCGFRGHNRGDPMNITATGNLIKAQNKNPPIFEQILVRFKRDTLWKIFIRFSLENLTLFGFVAKTKIYLAILFMPLTANEINGG
jgi:hypothetical protein